MVKAPPLESGRIGWPLKNQEKERVGSGRVAQGRMTGEEGTAVTLTVTFRNVGGTKE